jgi:hypothetical protein
MQLDHAQKPTPEMIALAATFKGAIQKIPTGKKTRRGPSKEPGQSGDRWRVDYSPAAHDNEVYGTYGGGDDQH